MTADALTQCRAAGLTRRAARAPAREASRAWGEAERLRGQPANAGQFAALSGSVGGETPHAGRRAARRLSLDAAGGELPAVAAEMLEAADFISSRTRVKTCANCVHNDGGVCQFDGEINGRPADLRGQPVNDHNCCYAWEDGKSVRDWRGGDSAKSGWQEDQHPRDEHGQFAAAGAAIAAAHPHPGPAPALPAGVARPDLRAADPALAAADAPPQRWVGPWNRHRVAAAVRDWLASPPERLARLPAPDAPPRKRLAAARRAVEDVGGAAAGVELLGAAFGRVAEEVAAAHPEGAAALAAARAAARRHYEAAVANAEAHVAALPDGPRKDKAARVLAARKLRGPAPGDSAKSGFDEAQHPRDEHGQFAEGGTGAGASNFGKGRAAVGSSAAGPRGGAARSRGAAESAMRHEIAEHGKLGMSPGMCNSGECGQIAARVVSAVRAAGGEADFGVPNVGPAHVWVVAGGRHFDAQHPEGVSDPSELTLFQDEPDLLDEGWRASHADPVAPATPEAADAADAEHERRWADYEAASKAHAELTDRLFGGLHELVTGAGADDRLAEALGVARRPDDFPDPAAEVRQVAAELRADVAAGVAALCDRLEGQLREAFPAVDAGPLRKLAASQAEKLGALAGAALAPLAGRGKDGLREARQNVTRLVRRLESAAPRLAEKASALAERHVAALEPDAPGASAKSWRDRQAAAALARLRGLARKAWAGRRRALGLTRKGWRPGTRKAGKDEANGQWVTLSPSGTHVFIEGGKISKGPAHMVGKAPHELSPPHRVAAEHGPNHPETGTPAGLKGEGGGNSAGKPDGGADNGGMGAAEKAPDMAAMRKLVGQRTDRGDSWREAGGRLSDEFGLNLPVEARASVAQYVYQSESYDMKPNPALPDESRPNLGLEEQGAVFAYTQEEGDYDPKALKRALGETRPFPEPVTCARGIEVEDEDDLEALVEELESGEMEWRKPASTTTSRLAFEGNVQFTISARRGLDASRWGTNSGELLLPGGSTFRVVSWRRRGDRFDVELEQTG